MGKSLPGFPEGLRVSSVAKRSKPTYYGPEILGTRQKEITDCPGNEKCLGTSNPNERRAHKGHTMSTTQGSNPLHGITLEMILTRLVEHYGWEKLGEKIAINCFTKDPSIKSSLKFLRKTPWAREKLESLYLHTRLRKEIL